MSFYFFIKLLIVLTGQKESLISYFINEPATFFGSKISKFTSLNFKLFFTRYVL